MNYSLFDSHDLCCALSSYRRLYERYLLCEISPLSTASVTAQPGSLRWAQLLNLHFPIYGAKSIKSYFTIIDSWRLFFYEQNAQAAHSVCCRFCLLQYAEYGFFHLSYLPLFGSLQLIILPKRGMPIPTSGSSFRPPMAVHWGCRCSRCACRR